MTHQTGTEPTAEATFELMEQLRADDWCVVLKCLPASMDWIIEGSRSEYDAPSPDTKLGKGKWCCELSCMRRDMRSYRPSAFAMHESPHEAVKLAARNANHD